MVICHAIIGVMASDRTNALFFELYGGLLRQGAGSAVDALRSLELVPGVGPLTRVFDIGCGTGAQTLVLAKARAPAKCDTFWSREYPAIRDTSALLEPAEACGYETVGHFPLPTLAWWDDFYRPLQDIVTAFRKRHRDAPDAQELVDQCQHEIDFWHAHPEFYGYEFLVLRVR